MWRCQDGGLKTAASAVAARLDAVDDGGDEQREEDRLERVEELKDAGRYRVDKRDKVRGGADGAGVRVGLQCQSTRCVRHARPRRACRERTVRGLERAALRRRCVRHAGGTQEA